MRLGRKVKRERHKNVKCIGDFQEFYSSSLSTCIAKENGTTPNENKQEMTFCMNKIGPQTRRQILCQVHRLSTATMTDNISQIKGQPNTQMLLLENYNQSSASVSHSCQVHPMGAHGTWLRYWARQNEGRHHRTSGSPQ